MSLKINMEIPCPKCDQYVRTWSRLTDTEVEITCDQGHQDTATRDSGIWIGQLLLNRAAYEYNESKDWALSIVFSAAALDCQLSEVYGRWTRINQLRGAWRHINDAELEEMLRRLRTVEIKFEEVGKLLDPEGFEGFVANAPDFPEIIAKGFSALSIGKVVTGIKESVFWPRNRILHLGEVETSEEQAKTAWNVARLGIQILQRMDSLARKRLRQEYRKGSKGIEDTGGE